MHKPTAKKHYGQHFLHDANIIAKIIRIIDPHPKQRMIEIGPGLGAITEPLIRKLGELQVIEIDERVIPPLREQCEPYGELTVHQADVLTIDFNALGNENIVR